jgi:hypothetical protein
VITKVDHGVPGKYRCAPIPFAVADEESVKGDNGLDFENFLGGSPYGISSRSAFDESILRKLTR